ncbi:MAG: histidine kinase [Gammaproteobacteria bacterium]|nr:histidine kinase [Gammaproteobacteria bacterium]
MEKKSKQPSQPAEVYLPNFCDIHFILRLLVVTELMAIVLSLNSAPFNSQLWEQLSITSLFMIWIALTSAAVLCLFGGLLNRLSNTAISIISYLLVLLITLCFSFITTYLADEFALNQFYPQDWDQQFILKNLAISSIVIAVLLRYFFIQHHWKLNQISEARTRLKALEARIRPHFLFNSMNTIASLVHDQPDTAETTIINLAELFRVSLRETTDHKLSDEIKLVRSYLAIEQLRLGSRLRPEWAIERFDKDILLPALSIQPLVENAIYHGVEPLPEGGVIKIRIYKHNRRLIISVSNPSKRKNGSTHKGNQMAQNNIRQRLMLAFGNTASFSIDEGPPLYTVTLNIPFE